MAKQPQDLPIVTPIETIEQATGVMTVNNPEASEVAAELEVALVPKGDCNAPKQLSVQVVEKSPRLIDLAAVTTGTRQAADAISIDPPVQPALATTGNDPVHPVQPEKPKDNDQAKPSVAADPTLAGVPAKPTKQAIQNPQPHPVLFMALSAPSKTFPKRLQEELQEKEDLRPRDIVDSQGYLLTAAERKAVLEAIREAIGQNKELVKIRRVSEEELGEISPEEFEPGKMPTEFTEFEKKQKLKFSVIVDKTGGAIALFRGQPYTVGGGGYGVVKLGQRLSDGAWVAVKIQKFNIGDLLSKKEELNKKIKELATVALKLKPQLEQEIAALRIDIDVIEKKLAEDSKHIKPEAKIAYEVGLQIGEAARASKNQQKFYSIQILLEGYDLHNHLSKKKPPVKDVGECFDIAREALLGLQILHKNNIIHGDIKPDNLIYLQNATPPTIVPIDFGHSLKLEEGRDTIVREDKGTPLFQAPEITLSGTFSKASDVYAMGLTLERVLWLLKTDFKTDPKLVKDPSISSKISRL